MKKLAVIKSEYIEITKSTEEYFKDKDVQIIKYDNINEFLKDRDITVDLTVMTDFERCPAVMENCGRVLNIHASLFPAFVCENPIKEAFTAGAKVTGVTVYYTDKEMYGRIIAQYPVLIGLTTSYPDLEKELEVVGQKLYPPVIDAVINDKVFDFSDLFKNGCSHTSGGCSRNAGACGTCCTNCSPNANNGL